MPLIEGFGDEVTLLLITLLAGVVVVLAWMSTQVDSRFLVPIIILDRERFSALMQRLRGITEQRFGVDEQLREDSPRPEVSDLQTEENEENSAVETTAQSVTGSAAGAPPSQDLDSLTQHQSRLPDSHPNVTYAEVERSCNDIAEDSNLEQTDSENYSNDDRNAGPESSSSVADDEQDIVTVEEPPSVFSADENLDPSGQAEESVITPEGHIQIRLQYVDGRQRMVFANPDDTVRDFKRNHFSSELAGHSVVRFVMSGQELRNDDLTLRSYRVSNGSVIHCLVTQARVDPVITSVDSHHFDIGFLMFPLFGCMLTLLWYARIVYRSYFSGASTFSLVAISFLYLIAIFGSFRSNRINHPHQD